MGQESSNNFLSYLFLLASIFMVFFVLDTIFGVHYQPEEHTLNKAARQSEQILDKDTLDQQKDSAAAIEKEPEIAYADSLGNQQEDEPKKSSEDKKEYSQAYFEKLISDYKTEVLQTLAPKEARKDIIIRYYRHPPDGNSAYALEELGFYIHERPVSPQYKNYQSNAIFYGDRVKLRDIQLVAYVLLKEGVPIKEIIPSKFGSSWKSNSIEIGTDTTIVDRPTLSMENVRKLSL